jgi:hypothetical protein
MEEITDMQRVLLKYNTLYFLQLLVIDQLPIIINALNEKEPGPVVMSTSQTANQRIMIPSLYLGLCHIIQRMTKILYFFTAEEQADLLV